MLEDLLETLTNMGWYRYLGEEDLCHWKTKGSNRYVDIELPYIDIYTYADEEKYKSWLSIVELHTFNTLVQFLDSQEERRGYEEILSYDLPQ